MERHPGFDQAPIPHASVFSGHCPHDTELEHGREHAAVLDSALPRMFALVRGGDDEETVAEVVAYGLALPGGAATTVGADGRGFGLWNSAHSAAWRLHSDLVWLGGDAPRPDASTGSPS